MVIPFADSSTLRDAEFVRACLRRHTTFVAPSIILRVAMTVLAAGLVYASVGAVAGLLSIAAIGAVTTGMIWVGRRTAAGVGDDDLAGLRRRLRHRALAVMIASFAWSGAALLAFHLGDDGQKNAAVLLTAISLLHLAIMHWRLMRCALAPVSVPIATFCAMVAIEFANASNSVVGDAAFGFCALAFVAYCLSTMNRLARAEIEQFEIDRDRRVLTKALEAERDAARRADAVKSEFMAMMSHELRTPLNGVIGMSEALATSDLSPKDAKRAATVRDAGRGLLGCSTTFSICQSWRRGGWRLRLNRPMSVR